MELRRYWQIIIRYWWIILLLFLVGIGAAYQYYTSNRPTYTNTLTVNISRDPVPNEPYSGYYANISSEYAADDFTQVIMGNVFLGDVSALLKTRGVNLSPTILKSLIEIERKHREIYVTVHFEDKVWSLAINRAIGDNLILNAGKYVTYANGAQPIRANLIDVPTDAPLSGGRTLLLALFRPLVGLIAGLALSFLLAYLDNSIRTAAEVKEVLGLPILTVIPGPSKRLKVITNGGNYSNNSVKSKQEEVAKH
jgi:capsular polysaccharide biosynthesis protein